MASPASTESTQPFSDVGQLEVDLEELTNSLITTSPPTNNLQFTRIFIRPFQNKHALRAVSLPDRKNVPMLADVLAISQTTRSIAYDITYPRWPNIGPVHLRLYFDPNDDSLTIVNESEEQAVQIQHNQRPFSAILPPFESRVIEPGNWTLLSSGSAVFEFQVRPRNFYRDAGSEPPARGGGKRALGDSQDAQGALTTKKQRTATVVLQVSQTGTRSQQHPLLALQNGQTAYLVGQGSEDTYSLTRQDRLMDTASANLYTAHYSKLPGQLVVVKALKPRSLQAHEAAEIWLREFTAHSGVGHHPSIVRLHASDARFLTLYVEHIDAPALDQPPWRDPASMCTLKQEENAHSVLHDIARALDWIHGSGFLHNDIKPANILYSRDRGAVLIDFGLGTRTSDPTHYGGSPWYLPPEFLASGTRGPPADVFALGVTMVWLLRKCRLPNIEPSWVIADLRNARGLATAEKRSTAQAAMRAWLDRLAQLRDGLSRAEDSIEHIVYHMLIEESRRWTARAVARKIAALGNLASE